MATATRDVDRLVTRPIEVVFVVLALVLLAPVMILTSVAILVSSGRPVMFTQLRIGKDQVPFTILKFRTMHQDADDGGHREQNLAELNGRAEVKQHVAFKDRDDPRVTRVGRVLRRFSLDELPQLINVLKGEMSLVGPRPCLTWELEAFPEWAEPRFTVRPGLTGAWQVAGRNELDMLRMLELDVEYVKQRSVGNDLSILARTPAAVLRAHGAA